MPQQVLEYHTPQPISGSASSRNIGAFLICAFTAMMVPANLWLYRVGVDKLDVIAEAIAIYIFVPAINLGCGIALFIAAFLVKRKRGRSKTITACLIMSAVVPMVAMIIDGALIGAAFR